MQTPYIYKRNLIETNYNYSFVIVQGVYYIFCWSQMVLNSNKPKLFNS